MQQPSSPTTDRNLRIPTIVWTALAIAVAGAASVTLFRVPLDLAATYGLFALLIVAHFGMHGGHGAHAHHQQVEGGEQDAEAEHRRHNGGCH